MVVLLPLANIIGLAHHYSLRRITKAHGGATLLYTPHFCNDVVREDMVEWEFHALGNSLHLLQKVRRLLQQVRPQSPSIPFMSGRAIGVRNFQLF